MSNYTELFSMSITHTYYTGGVCPDFSLEPTPRCRELLKDHRILLKNKTDGLQLLLPVTQGNIPFIGITDVTKFSFYMKLRETAFDSYTDLTIFPAPDTNEMYGFNNQSVRSGELLYEPVKRPDADLPVNTASVFAIIDIYVDQISADLGNPSRYTIDFTAKKITWNYYFITNKYHQKDLAVEMDDNTITFSEDKDVNSDSIGRELLETYPDNEIYLFRSDTEVSYQQQGRKNIVLNVYERVNDPNPDIPIEHLPNPGLYDNGVKVLRVTINESPGGGN